MASPGGRNRTYFDAGLQPAAITKLLHQGTVTLPGIGPRVYCLFEETVVLPLHHRVCSSLWPFRAVAILLGFEPRTSRVTAGRANQLRHRINAFARNRTRFSRSTSGYTDRYTTRAFKRCLGPSQARWLCRELNHGYPPNGGVLALHHRAFDVVDVDV